MITSAPPSASVDYAAASTAEELNVSGNQRANAASGGAADQNHFAFDTMLLKSPFSSAIHKAALMGVKELRPMRSRSAARTVDGYKQAPSNSARLLMVRNFDAIEFIRDLLARHQCEILIL